MSNNVSNIILSVIFAGMGIWMLRGYIKTHDKIKYKDKKWNGYRIVFLVAGLMVLATIFTNHTVYDIIRAITMVFCCVAFLLQRDGIGDEGVCSVGRFTPYQKIRAYDYQREKKKFVVYFAAKDEKDGGEYFITISFAPSDEEKVLAFLKKTIGKKYTRMRKG